MFVGSRTFAGDMLTRLGLVHVLAGAPDRYPKADPADFAAAPDRHPKAHTGPAGPAAARAELAVLPDEPYVFTANDGPESFPGIAVALVSGRNLTWYGPSLVTARSDLIARIKPAITA
jgi:hypothetical protein